MKTLEVIKQILIAFVLTIVLPVSNALTDGGVSSGGGDTVTEKNIIELLDLAETGEEYLDQISLIMGWREIYSGLFGDRISRILGVEFQCFMAKSLLGEKANIFCPKISPNTKVMLFVFSSVPLEELNDEGIIHLKENASRAIEKRQLARQDLDANVVVYKPDFENLRNDDALEKIKHQQGLIVHEALVRMVIQYNISEIKNNGTANIRKLTRLLVAMAYGEVVPERAIKEAFLKLGVQFPK